MFNILAVTSLSKPAAVMAKLFVFVLTMPFVMDIPVDVEIDMIEQGIPFKVVESMPERFDVASSSIGYYSLDEDMIYFVSADGTFSYDEFLNSACHEMIHYYRDQSNTWSGDKFIEEMIACYGANKLDKIMGMNNMDISHKELDKWFLDCQISNKIEHPRLPTDEEKQRMNIEIVKLAKYISGS